MVSLNKNKKIAALITIIIILAQITAVAAAPPQDPATPLQEPAAKAVLLAEVNTGVILLDYNMTTRLPADSLARVMTLIITITAIENGEVFVDDVVQMSESAWFDIGEGSSTRNITRGEEMLLIDLLYCAFIGRANEACNLIAEYVAGSVSAFVALMNKRADELGCDDTRFTNPHGQYNAGQYTTALDQYRIYREAISYPLFNEIAGQISYSVEETNASAERRLYGSNYLLDPGQKYYYRPCITGLAGNTYEGGFIFAGYAESNDLSLIIIVLGSDVVMNEDNSANMRNLSEARRLFDWGFTQFGWRTILSSSELVTKVYVEHGDGADYINLRPETEIRRVIDNDVKDTDFKRTIRVFSDINNEILIAPIEAGEVLGEVTITRFDRVTEKTIDYGTVLLVANTSIGLHRFQYMRLQIEAALASPVTRGFIWILVIALLIYIALVVRYNVVRLNRIRKINKTKRRLIDERHNEQEWDHSNDPRLR